MMLISAFQGLLFESSWGYDHPVSGGTMLLRFQAGLKCLPVHFNEHNEIALPNAISQSSSIINMTPKPQNLAAYQISSLLTCNNE
jgi:hypothetical protein